MTKPTGKLLFAYQTIARLEAEAQALRDERDLLWQTFFNLAEKLGIDPEVEKSAPGKPSDVFLRHIEALRARVVVVPDECPHLILFDDADMKPIILSGDGARECAQVKWERVSHGWNAHLFVRIEKNSRDDIYPSCKAVSEGLLRRLTVQPPAVCDIEGQWKWQREHDHALDELRALLDEGEEVGP